MRMPQYLSPTSIGTFYSNRDEFYIKYLAENKPANMPQTVPMAVGSSFDAYIKNFLFEKLFGKTDERFTFETLFESQVEPQNRDVARRDGKHCFDEYYKSGAVADLMLELQKCSSVPRFEFSINGIVEGYKEGVTTTRGGVPLLGKPDVYFINSSGAHVIFDWKVNGYYSSHGASPLKGYAKLRQGMSNLGQHKDSYLISHKGTIINVAQCFSEISYDWSRQLCIYAWLLGEDIGSDFIVAIDQLACRQGSIRVASHRSRVSEKGQWKILTEAQNAWSVIQSGHIFDNISRAESDQHCALLEERAKMYKNDSVDLMLFPRG